jgi:hypothetical protein
VAAVIVNSNSSNADRVCRTTVLRPSDRCQAALRHGSFGSTSLAAFLRLVLNDLAGQRPYAPHGEHFKELYGPTIAAQANARRTEREAEFVEALNDFCDEWNRGTADRARFEMEFLLAVGTRQ